MNHDSFLNDVSSLQQISLYRAKPSSLHWSIVQEMRRLRFGGQHDGGDTYGRGQQNDEVVTGAGRGHSSLPIRGRTNGRGGRGGRGGRQQSARRVTGLPFVDIPVPSTKLIGSLTSNELMSIGLSLVGFPNERQGVDHDLERFKAHFGPCPVTLLACFTAVQAKHGDDFACLKDAFMACNFLKCYARREVMAGTWKRGEKYIGVKTKEYVKMIASLMPEKIVFGDFNDDEDILFAVDCVHFMQDEFRLEPDTKWWSHKRNMAALTYEIACAINRSAIVSVRGPYPAGTNDITIFRGGPPDKPFEWDPESLYHKVPERKFGVADGGYLGEPEKLICKHPNEEITKVLGRWCSLALARQENNNANFRAYNVLDNRFRHVQEGTEGRMEFHRTCVHAVAVLVQFGYENGHPLSDLRVAHTDEIREWLEMQELGPF